MSHKISEKNVYGLMRPRLTSTKVRSKKGSAHHPKHTSSSVKHIGGSAMAASGVGSLIFIDDVTHDASCRMNSKVYKNILSDGEMRPN